MRLTGTQFALNMHKNSTDFETHQNDMDLTPGIEKRLSGKESERTGGLSQKFKQWLRDRKIFERIVASNLITIGIMISLGLAIIFEVNNAATTNRKILHHPVAVSNAVLTIETFISQATGLTQLAMQGGSAQELSGYEQNIAAYDKAILSNFNLINERFLGEANLLKTANAHFEHWSSNNIRLLSMIKAGDTTERIARLNTEAQIVRGALEKSLNEMNALAQNNVNFFSEEGKRRSTQTIVEVVIMIILATILALLMSSLAGRSIEAPISALAKVMRALSKGDFNVQLPKIYSTRFEAGAIAKAAALLRNEALENAYLIEQAGQEKQKAEVLAQKAEASSQAKSDFLAMMSHELRTPMNAILGSAQLLKTLTLDDEQSEHVRTMIDGGEILMTVLNDILDFSKIEAGKLDISATNVDIRHLVRRLNRLWLSKANENGIDLICTVDDAVPSFVKMDGTRLRQILYNLLSNAIKFTTKGEVRLSVSVVGKKENMVTLRFDVTDTGIGITKAVQARLFNAFEQADKSTTRQFGGTGLGLAISQRLARLMGGDITVTSKERVGSCFTTKISAPVVNHITVPQEDIENTSQSAPVQARRQLSILAAEDNALNRRVLAAFLKPLNANLSFAEDGEAALHILQSQAFDVVLMDIQMPKMDGTEVVMNLRAKKGPNQNAPVIAMTANALQGDRETYLSAGMDGYVPKPIDPGQLLSSISKLALAPKAGKNQAGSTPKVKSSA